MCGIIASLGYQTNTNLLNGLKHLQNRGYDSAGITTFQNNSFITHKFCSSKEVDAIDKIQDIISLHQTSKIGIGHTRWATHGIKNKINSHPHLSSNKLFCLVHNGIIDNYNNLKVSLNKKIFLSQTDSEVIVNLIEYHYENISKTNSKSLNLILNNVIQSIKITLSQLEGSWGLVILCKLLPNYMFCSRKDSPLLVSIDNKDKLLISSEKSGFSNKVSSYIVLDNNDLCISYIDSNNTIQMETENIYKPIPNVKIDYNISHQPYSSWLEKEIREQKFSSSRIIDFYLRDKIILESLDNKRVKLEKINNIILIACGTSYYAAQIGRSYLKNLDYFNTVQVFDGADFEENDIPNIGETVFILLSQSGETKDLFKSIQIAKKKNILLIGIINVEDSLISREVDCICYLKAKREVSVASTKSFTSQVIMLVMISIWFSQIHFINESTRHQQISDLRKLHLDIEKTIEISFQEIQNLILKLDFIKFRSCFILGKGISEFIAKEGSLKLKEITYIHAEGYATSSLKHGPFALLEDNFPVIILAPYIDNDKTYNKILNSYEEVKTRGANIIYISNINNINNINNILIPTNKSFQELLSVIPLQILTLQIANLKKINPDKPRNLAKVVTVD